MERRSFLRGLLGLSAAGLAAKLSLPSLAMAEEVKADLVKDLVYVETKNPVSVAVPAVAFENRPVYASVAPLAAYWEDEIRKDLGRAFGEAIDKAILASLGGMTRELARRLDDDLKEAKVEDQLKLVVDKPRWDLVKGRGRLLGDRDQLEIRAGVRAVKTIWGNEWRVGHIPDEKKLILLD